VGGGAVDDGDRRAIRAIRCIEQAPVDEPEAERAKIVRSRRVDGRGVAVGAAL